LVTERGLPQDKIRQVHYGINVESFGHPSRDLRREWGLDGRPLIGSIARLEPRKGLEVLIRATKGVVEEFPDALLLIAGSDPSGYRSHLDRIVDELGLTSSVRFVGFQSDITSFLHSLDVFAFASRSEGFGQVVIEAMAASRPVVVSDIEPLNEIVQDERTGLVCKSDPEPFARAIIETLRNPEATQERAQGGLKRVTEHFSAERMCDEMVSLYEDVVSRR
jgi:glycosyltransferase involved in cell wall biosynthesis